MYVVGKRPARESVNAHLSPAPPLSGQPNHENSPSRAPPPLISPPQSEITPRPLAYPVSCSASVSAATTPWPAGRCFGWPTRCRGCGTWWIQGRRSSVVPPSSDDPLAQPCTAYDLLAANNPPIATYGTRTLRLSVTPASSFIWSFGVGRGGSAYPGVDFLSFHDLLVVSPGAERLLHRPTNTIIPTVPLGDSERPA
ncbi:hypothetical protein GWK47_041102 [Chionoecetes opilio]|uniref:Uncharacterized protein n=1 Tax=Chionoecetes opilio TaxID=41210 RepID=A0A8J5D0P1_CHIOP|nr:hypothetical protein GWK47_041102 [Chionoecetes opilio]